MIISVTLSISSNTKTGFDDFAFLTDLIILPGIAPIYVLRCPLISASSLKPPNEILHIFFQELLQLICLMMFFLHQEDQKRQIIGDFISPFNFNTAKCSIILSLTCSNPK